METEIPQHRKASWVTPNASAFTAGSRVMAPEVSGPSSNPPNALQAGGCGARGLLCAAGSKQSLVPKSSPEFRSGNAEMGSCLQSLLVAPAPGTASGADALWQVFTGFYENPSSGLRIKTLCHASMAHPYQLHLIYKKRWELKWMFIWALKTA